jgi:hypothetical protein
MLAAGISMWVEAIRVAARMAWILGRARWFVASRRQIAISCLFLLHDIDRLKRHNRETLWHLRREYPEYRQFLDSRLKMIEDV